MGPGHPQAATLREGSVASLAAASVSSFTTTATLPPKGLPWDHPQPFPSLSQSQRGHPRDNSDAHSVADSSTSTTRKRKASNFFNALKPAKKDKDPALSPAQQSLPAVPPKGPTDRLAAPNGHGALGSSLKGKGRASAEELSRPAHLVLAPPSASASATAPSPYPKPPASAPPTSMSFDDESDDGEIVVQRPRVSKQAKMLGVGAQDLDAAQGSIGDNWDGWGSKSSSSSARPTSPAAPNGDSLSPWKGPDSVRGLLLLSPSQRVVCRRRERANLSAPLCQLAPHAAPGRKQSIIPARLVQSSSSPSRTAKVPAKEASVKETKKKWGVSSIFRKPSKGTLREGEQFLLQIHQART